MLGKNNKASEEIFSWFRKKYYFGELGLFECIAAASLKAENLKYSVSSIVIAPAGEAKTETMHDLHEMFPDEIILKEGIVSEYWIARNIPQDMLNDRLFCIGDLSDSLKAMQGRRVNGMLAFYKNIIDGRAQIQQAMNDIDYTVKKVGFLINVPAQAMSERTVGYLVTTTFFDRMIPFQFATKWEEWAPLWIKKKLHNTPPLTQHTKKTAVHTPQKFRKRIVDEANFLRKLKMSGLPRNINLMQAFLAGNAILNNRKEITADDFKVWQLMKPYIRW